MLLSASLDEGFAFEVRAVPLGAWEVQVWQGGRQVGGVEGVEAGTLDLEVVAE